jgi:ATP-dependent helicase/nuclease subunit B
LAAAAAAGRTILAPNAELSAALFDALERAHRDAGDEIWPTPRIFDLSSWLREQHLQQQLTGRNSARLLSDIEERELWRNVVEGAALGRDFLDPAGAARAARRARRTLSEYNIPLQALERDRSDEAAAFLGWNRAFEARCLELNCISADTLLADALPADPQSPSGAVDWIENPLWRPAARRWLERHGRMLLPEDAGAGAVSVFKAHAAADELAAMADWARRESSDERFRAWICVPDLNRRRAEIIDAFDAALAPQRFALGASGAAGYAVAGGTPLADYAPVRVALELLQASVGSVPFAQFSMLLRSPHLQGSDAEAGSAARLDVALRRRASSEADLTTWLDLAERVARSEELGASPGVQRLRSAQQQLSQLQGAHRFSEWGVVWIAALETAPWAFRARWSSTEYQAAERLRELLATLASGDAVFGTHGRESAQRILRRALRETQFQAQTGVPRIWVSGQILDPFLNYDGLWVGNCSDEQWPPPTAPVALLPVRLQRQYGVVAAGADAQLAHARELQNRWQKRANHCVFSYADSAEGGLSSPSPLLPKSAPLAAAPTAAPQPHWHAMFESAPELQSLWDELAAPYPAGELARGVATLRAQSRCAFRGFAEARLDAQPLERPIPGFNERERGEIVHHALEHIWSVLRDATALAALHPIEQGRLLNAAAVYALEIVRKRRDPGKKWREREQARLLNLLGKWLDVERARAAFSVESLETNDQVASFAGLNFRVRIDRVDRLADGARVLLDYKTGAASADWRGERPDNPQLPIYALLRPDALVAVAYAKVNAAESGFVAESERSKIFPRSHETKLEGMASFADLVNVWSRRLERIAGEFAAGHAEVAPTNKACNSCHLQGLCRVPAALEEADESHE